MQNFNYFSLLHWEMFTHNMASQSNKHSNIDVFWPMPWIAVYDAAVLVSRFCCCFHIWTMTFSTTGIIMPAVAELLSHIDKNQEGSMKPTSILRHAKPLLLLLLRGLSAGSPKGHKCATSAAELSTVHMSTVNILSTVKQKCLQLCSESLNRNIGWSQRCR